MPSGFGFPQPMTPKRPPLSIFRDLSFALVVAFVTIGCASVTPRSNVASHPATKPERIYIAPFTAPAANIRADRDGQELAAFQDDIIGHLAEDLAQQIDANLVPTEIIADPSELPRSNAWLIVGQFDRVEQGSRALRALVGFGLGGTKVVTTSIVYDLSTPQLEPVMSIRTSGGSNAPPGAAPNLTALVALGPGGVAGLTIATGAQAVLGAGRVAVGAGIGILPGLTADIRRTAREITATLSEYSFQQGWIPAEQAMIAKRPGSGKIRTSEPRRPGYELPEFEPASTERPGSRQRKR